MLIFPAVFRCYTQTDLAQERTTSKRLWDLGYRKGLVMIAQWDSSLSVLPVARVMIAQRENE